MSARYFCFGKNIKSKMMESFLMALLHVTFTILSFGQQQDKALLTLLNQEKCNKFIIMALQIPSKPNIVVNYCINGILTNYCINGILTIYPIKTHCWYNINPVLRQCHTHCLNIGLTLSQHCTPTFQFTATKAIIHGNKMLMSKLSELSSMRGFWNTSL